MLRTKLFDGLKRISAPFRAQNPHRDNARRQHGFRRPRLECLERRELLSVGGWVTTADGPETGADDLVTDGDGNVYVSGAFVETADFAPGDDIPGDTLTATSGGFEMFAAKYTPDGALDWVSSLGPSSEPYGLYTSIALDEVRGSIYVTSTGGDLWKVNSSNGTEVWSDYDDSSLKLNDVAVDSATGDLYLTGSFSGSITTNDTVSDDPITLTSAGYDDIYIAKANSEGDLYWAQQKGSRRTSNAGNRVAIDDLSGDVYVTGHISDKGLGTVGASDIFISKLDPTDGSFAWIKRAGGDSNHAPEWGDNGNEIIVDSGSVYVTGSIGPKVRSNPADFGDITIDLPNSDVRQYGVVTRLNAATGDFDWAVPFGGDGADDFGIGGSLEFDSTDQLHLGGLVTIRESTFGSYTLPATTGPSNGFWATMSAATGEFEEVTRIGTESWYGADILTLDVDDNLFMAGYLRGLDQEFLTGDILSSTPDDNGNPTYDMVLVKLLADDSNNTRPVAVDDSFSTPEDAPVTIATADLLANDSDDDENPLTIQSFGSPGHGTLVDNENGTITYTPNLNFNGDDTFTYTISDGNGGTDTGTVTVTVAAMPDDPVADAGGPYTVSVDGTVTLDASGTTDPDLPDGDTLAYAWDFDDDGVFLDASGVAPTFDATEFSDVVPIAVQVTDSTGNTSIAATTVTVQVVPSELIFDYLGDPKNIGDNKIVTTTIDISGTGVSIGDLTVGLNLTHASPSDLTAWLIAPDGTTTFTLNSGGSTPILDGIHDYAVPDAANLDLDGVWTLKVEDSLKNRKRGTLIGWSMTVTPLAAAASSQSTATAADLALLSLFDPDPTDDDETDPLTESLVDDLALMLV